MESIWRKSAAVPSFPKVEKDLKTNVLIIGGGICGILCAYLLQEIGVDYILAEADEICKKTTANTTAKISSLHGMIYNKLLNSIGKSDAYSYYLANSEAISDYEKLCKDIDCDFEKTSAYLFTLDNTNKLKKEFDAIKAIGIDASFEKKLDIPFNAMGGIKFENQAQFNPLKFISSICKDLKIYEHSRVTEMLGNCAVVGNYKITADKVIVATHFPFINKHGSYFIKMYQHRSYVMAFKSDKKVDGMFVSDTKYGLSLRQYNDLIILGGEGHRTGKKSQGWQGLEAIANKYFPGNKVVARWAAQDCMTLDSMPYVGNYSARTPNLYVATGFNKWGMTGSMVAAKILCDLIQGKENKYAQLFSPSRSMLKPQLAINAIKTMCNYLIPTTRRCPHLGCALKWNRCEHSWDCSCHGSRFANDGHLLDGPSNNDLHN